MRNIAILCLLLACTLPALAGTYRADEIPNVQRMDRRRYVSDPDGILSPAAVAHIDSVCASLRERGLAQVAVVAVDDIAGGDTFSFAVDLFRSWGVGSAKSNNGLGILLVKDLREIRFVTGGGLEGILPDALCKRIQLNYMLPAFREGDYSAGMVAGVGAAATILEGGEVDLGGDADEDLPAWMIFTIVFGFVIFPLGMVLANYYFSRRCPKCRKLTLKQQSQQVLSVTRNYRLVVCLPELRCSREAAFAQPARRQFRQRGRGRHDHRRRLRTRHGRRHGRRLRRRLLRRRRSRFALVV